MTKAKFLQPGCLVPTIIGVSLLLIGLIAVASVIGSLNDYSRLEVRAKAVEQDNRNVLDNSRKRIQESAAISRQEVDALIGIITGYAEKRGPNASGGGGVINIAAVREAVPSVTEVKTLQTLMNLVNGARADWQNAQTRLIEVKRQADEKLAVFPSNMVLGMFGKKPIDIVIVTSEQTEENFRTGKDNGNWIETGKSEKQ